MHVVFVIAPGGGPEAYVRTVAPELEKCGHHVSVVFTVPPSRVGFGFSPSVRVVYAPPADIHYYLAKVIGGFRALPLRLRAWESARAVFNALSQIDRADRIDLVEVTEGLPLASLKRRWRVILRAHGSDWTFRFVCQDGNRRNDRWLIELEAQQLNDVHAVSTISQHLADHVSTFCRFPRHRIQVIPYPINAESFQPAASTPTEPILLSVGRLEKRKGVDVLCNALSRVWVMFPDVKVYLLGNEAGYRQSDLRRLVPTDKQTQIIFPGFVDRRTLADYYQRATLYVAPTLYETFAYTILEAMACGLPVIASRVGAIPELVDDGATGLLVPPGDSNALAEAINTLLNDTARRKQMGQRAREKAVAEYSVDRIVEKTLRFYKQALAGSGNFQERRENRSFS